MSNIDANTLSSEWGALSPHLIGSIYEVKRDGQDPNKFVKVQDSPVVQCPFTESSFEVSLSWQSPFENASNDIAPTFKQLLQSGTLLPTAQKIDSSLGTSFGKTLEQLQANTGVTKLNSTQVFMGEPPAKFTVTAQFRAWRNPQSEVHDPVNQLMKWALPVKLAQDGIVLSRLANGGAKEAVFPSYQPVTVAVLYKGVTYSPLVIESISIPTDSPIDKTGKFVELQIPITLCTLTALDRADWANFISKG